MPAPICSLCCSLDARCHDLCKPHAHLRAQAHAVAASILPERAIEQAGRPRLGRYGIAIPGLRHGRHRRCCLGLIYYFAITRRAGYGGSGGRHDRGGVLRLRSGRRGIVDLVLGPGRARAGVVAEEESSAPERRCCSRKSRRIAAPTPSCRRRRKRRGRQPSPRAATSSA